MLVLKLDDPAAWAKAREVLAEGENLDHYFQQAVLAELQYLRKKILEGFRTEAPAGRKWAPLSPITLAVRSWAGFKGTKILTVTRDLMGSITVIPVADELGGFVGVARSAARKDGKSNVNLAELHEKGATFRESVTAAQRRFLFAALAAAGVDTSAPPAGKAPGTGTSIEIRIPPRPFLSPIFETYAKPEDVARSVLARVCKQMKNALGTPEGGARPRE